ncbi:hypothetical protein C9382_08800 [Pseudomonas aylmerensis]|uniref:Uncharacterized protein n=1 Tax=Pseudomonas aylmerensis TaxID=1869229 RepID=A0A2T4G4W5_9PSED|nr:hypothetical protein C9382_08800 [Pseudomonas aylmerensis]
MSDRQWSALALALDLACDLILGTEWWGKSLLVTFGWAGLPVLPKVTRRKGGTISSRYPNNGYVPRHH